MKKLRIAISLPGDNRYLVEQAAIAETTAKRLGMEVRFINAHGDPVTQSQQLLEIIQSPPASRPDIIIVEPANESGLPRVAEVAVAAGLGWVVSNACVGYLKELRKNAKAPVFGISQDHRDIGSLQGRQFGALLPEGGTVLYLRGPGTNYLASQRTEGMERALPSNVQAKTLKIQWTEESCYQSVSSWLRLSTVRAGTVDLVSSQNTDFIAGARRAFQAHTSGADQTKWLSLPCTAAGILKQTQPLVDKGTLAAAVITSLTMDGALEMLAKANQDGANPPEQTLLPGSSYPSIEELARKRPVRLFAPPSGSKQIG